MLQEKWNYDIPSCFIGICTYCVCMVYAAKVGIVTTGIGKGGPRGRQVQQTCTVRRSTVRRSDADVLQQEQARNSHPSITIKNHECIRESISPCLFQEARYTFPSRYPGTTSCSNIIYKSNSLPPYFSTLISVFAISTRTAKTVMRVEKQGARKAIDEENHSIRQKP